MDSDDDEDVPILITHELPSNGTQCIDVDKELGSRVPCTLICGFLGAGKSTLLRRILTERHGQRIAVIMNEFGDTADIEGARAINISSEGTKPGELTDVILELANGCLCCSIKDSGLAAIEKLMLRKGAFDYILLETTGLADPGPIASMFWQNEEFSSGLGRDIYLDGVVCVVDAVFGDKQMAEDHASDGIGESLRQIACADTILLNKVDLVTEDELVKVETAIHLVNPAVPIHRTVRGEVDLKLVIDLNAYASRPSMAESISCGAYDHDHSDPAHGHEQALSTRHDVISSLQVTCPIMTPDRVLQLDEWIRIVLWENHLPDEVGHRVEVLRCKGIYHTESGETCVLQGVRSLYEMSSTRSEEKLGLPVPQAGKLVFIGKGLNGLTRASLLHALR